MKALVLLATLKEKGISNTALLSEFAMGHLKKEVLNVRLYVLQSLIYGQALILSSQLRMDFAAVYDKIIKADILIFATPIWWNSHSSELQRVIERLDEVFDNIEEGKPSPLEGKLGGVIITGDSDGVEHITGNIANFFTCVGVTVPAMLRLALSGRAIQKGKGFLKQKF